jgi:hypothetical protein
MSKMPKRQNSKSKIVAGALFVGNGTRPYSESA